MKKQLFTLGLSALLLSSCYEDKGNYDYSFDRLNHMGEFQFTPSTFQDIDGTSIELQQPIGQAKTERIVVEFPQTLSNNLDHLDFEWKRSYRHKGQLITDTVRTAGYMDVELQPNTEMKYNVLLRVSDKTTGLSRYQQLSIKTRPLFKNSLFVLHGNAVGQMKLGNIEEIGGSVVVHTDANAVVQSSAANPFSHSVALAYSSLYDRGESNTLVAFNQDGTTVGFNPFGLTPRYRSGYVLSPQVKNFSYDRQLSVGTAESMNDHRLLFDKNGKYYTAGSFLCFHTAGEVESSNTDYHAQAGTITASHFLLWDKLHQRFLYQNSQVFYGYEERQARSIIVNTPIYDAHVDFSALSPELSPVGKEAIFAYVPYKENYDKAKPFFVFRDSATQRAYLYELTHLAVGDGKDKKVPVRLADDKDKKDDDKDKIEEDTTPVYSITAKRLPNFSTATTTKTLLYNMWFTSNLLFFAEGGSLYRYNTSDGSRTLLYSAPEGYEIAVLKWRTTDSGNYKGDLGRYLSVGMNKGNQGAVTELKFTTAADLDESFVPHLYTTDKDGQPFGKIVDLQFAHIYTYQTLNFR